MFRELAISAYLFFFKMLFHLFKLFPQKKKTVCVASFGDNIFYTVRSIRDLSDEEIIIIKDKSCHYQFDRAICKVLPFGMITHPIAYLQSIYHLATATTILVDNYFGFLAVTDFKKGTTCIQLWHAAGAIKKFGLQNPHNKSRTPKAIQRFQKVYNRFDYTIVGSENMVNIFKESFNISEDSILRTGIPRTDIFYDLNEKRRIYNQMKSLYSQIQNKKVILYAPTFRGHRLNHPELAFDLKRLYEALSDDYILMIKQHPSVSFELNEKYNGFMIDVSDYYDINHLLLITDLLITDYSSVAFEFALLEKPMIFYAYDIKEYKHTSGLIDSYELHMPGPVVKTTEQLILAIHSQPFDMNKIRVFAEEWNQYSKGSASINLAKIVTKVNDEEKKEKVYI